VIKDKKIVALFGSNDLYLMKQSNYYQDITLDINGF